MEKEWILNKNIFLFFTKIFSICCYICTLSPQKDT
jgi:hypothetical protein